MNIAISQNQIAFLQLTNKNKVENSDKVIFDEVKEVKKQSTSSNTFSAVGEYAKEIFLLSKVADKIMDNVEVLSQSQATELATIGNKLISKSFGIINNAKTAAFSYAAEINAILADPSLSDSEKNKRIEKIKEKIKNIFYEASLKIEQLRLFSSTLKSYIPVFNKLHSDNIDAGFAFLVLSEMVENINTNPSDLTKCEDSGDIRDVVEKNENNLFDVNNEGLVVKNLKEVKEQIKILNEEIESNIMPEEEKEGLRLKLIIYESLENILKNYV